MTIPTHIHKSFPVFMCDWNRDKRVKQRKAGGIMRRFYTSIDWLCCFHSALPYPALFVKTHVSSVVTTAAMWGMLPDRPEGYVQSEKPM